MQTVKEVRMWAGTQSYSIRNFVDYAKDQKIRELISDAELEGIEVTELILRMAGPKDTPKKVPATKKPKRTASCSRKKDGYVDVQTGSAKVCLTPKQLEFMERLSECQGWDEHKEDGQYLVAEYAEELSDTMNPVSVGAMVTTLREKGLITTEKAKIGGVRGCAFTLTEKGKEVYRALAGGRYD